MVAATKQVSSVIPGREPCDKLTKSILRQASEPGIQRQGIVLLDPGLREERVPE
jgi:hypothetical protein